MPRDSLAEISNEALMVLYAHGDPDAARMLMHRLLPLALTHASRVLGDRTEAEDVAQEAMMRLWRVAPEWRQDEARVSTWLYRVVANLCTDRLRLRTRRHADPIDLVAEPVDASPGVEAVMIAEARMKALQTALDQLPERQRQAVILRHIEGLANPEIAVVLNIGVEAVESLTARGKRTLSAILSGRKAEFGYEEMN